MQRVLKYIRPYFGWVLLCASLLNVISPTFPTSGTQVMNALLVGSGVLGWAAFFLYARPALNKQNVYLLTLIAVIVLSCLWDISGSSSRPRLTSFSSEDLLICIGCGLGLTTLRFRWVLIGLYGLAQVLAISALPFDYVRYASLYRPGGLVGQADILAVLLGVGLVGGYYIYRHAKLARTTRYWLLAGQAWLLIVIAITQTRLVLGFVCACLVVLMVSKLKQLPALLKLIVSTATILLFVMAAVYAPSRISSLSYGVNSVSYRYDLDKAGLHALSHMPFDGYGMQAIPIALSCPKLTSPSLVKTCRQGFVFNSTHNIYIDRLLSLGWFGGVAYTLVIVLSITWLLKRKSHATAICLILISIYYLTNVTVVGLEIIVWILLTRAVVLTKHTPPTNVKA